MSLPHYSVVRPGAHIILRLPSGVLKPVHIQKNATINNGKYGIFSTNSIINRPYYLTYELLEREESAKHHKLRVVPASELNSEDLANEPDVPNAQEEIGGGGEAFDILGENGEVVMRNNRFTVDDASRQALTATEIEELKKAGTGSGKEIIEKIMAAHSAIDEKTKFSLAKYTLRKTKKYMRRFTVLPMDVNNLTEMLLEKEATKIMELRPEVLGLITSWANVHHAGNLSDDTTRPRIGGGRYLVVDDTAGLLVAAIAEKMNLLYERDEETRRQELDELWKLVKGDDDTTMQLNGEVDEMQRNLKSRELFQAAETNTITLVHAHGQPNLSLLKLFGFVQDETVSNHPLYTNLHTLTWLQLLDPEADRNYTEEQEHVTEEELATWKTSRRGAYYRKRRRWERTKRVVDEAREGGFDGLLVASWMKPEGLLKYLVPLVKSGGQVVVYRPTVEPLTELMDYYSRERRSEYITQLKESLNGESEGLENHPDFPVDPSLILHPTLQSTRAIEWQVLPMRTHPLMISRGGAEGYVFIGTRVLPAATPVTARGRFSKKRKQDVSTDRETKRVKDDDTPYETAT